MWVADSVRDFPAQAMSVEMVFRDIAIAISASPAFRNPRVSAALPRRTTSVSPSNILLSS
jgi:hypothetical protein